MPATRRLFLPPVLLAVTALSACSVEGRRHADGGTDINAAATAAQGDIDTYAGNRLAMAPPVTTATATPVADSNSSDPDGAAPTVKAPDAVVRSYYAAIAARRYDDAFALWDDDGRAAGMTRGAFADSFAKYGRYDATVGAPGRIDAGAGQRYVEVPVRIAGALADGRPVALAGTLTLHRVGDIDGATAAQRSWRIRDSSIRPRPTEARAVVGPVVYACTGRTRVSVRFDNDADTATLDPGDAPPVVLEGQRVASGIWYRGSGYDLRGKGREATLTAPGATPVACTSD